MERKKIHFCCLIAEKIHRENLVNKGGNGMSLKNLTQMQIGVGMAAPSLLITVLTAVFFTVFLTTAGSSVHAQDLDDVEADMESVLGESEAAQSEAAAAKRREQEERAKLARAKKDANSAMAKAKTKEVEAKKQIKDMETLITVSVREQAQFNKLKADADQKIVVLDEKILAKKTELEKAQAMRDAARTEKEAQEAVLAKKVEEQKDLEQNIIKDREEAQRFTTQIAELTKQAVEKEKQLVRLRENSRREAEKRDKLKGQRDDVKRKVSQIPSKVILRTSKYDCDVTDAAGDGAKALGKIKKGQRYELYRVHGKRWVEIQYQSQRGFVEKTCF